jgi:GBP family porin
MYRKIIAVLAISLVTVEAHAQSSVTLSGIIDGGISFTNGVGATDKTSGRTARRIWSLAG